MFSRLAERVATLAGEIQQIPAPTHNEAARANFVYARFQEAGLQDVHQDEIGNVYARLPGKTAAAPLVVSAHLDTVFPEGTPMTLKQQGMRLYGPGIGDNSLGVAGLFGLVWGLQEQGAPVFPLPADIWLVANVGEEGLGDLRGMRAVVERFALQARAFLILEGLALGYVYHQGLGVRRYAIEINTEGGHSWVDFGRPSAVHEMARLITRLLEQPLPEEPRTTLNVGKFTGGLSVNTIAAQAEIELDLRSESRSVLEQLAHTIEGIVRATHKEGVQVSMKKVGERPAGSLPAHHPLIRLAQQTLIDQGIEPRLTIGSTDANLPLSRGLPAVCLGLARGGGAHTLEEFIEIPSLEVGLKVLLNFVPQVCSLTFDGSFSARGG